MFTWQQNCLLPLNKRNDVWWSCQVWVVRGADHNLWSTVCKLQAWKKALGRVKRQYQDVDLGIGNQLTLPVTTVFSGHSDRSIENEMKVHCVSKTDCLVSRVSAVLPDPCLACNGPAESTWQTWERHIIQRTGWLRRLSQGATEGQVDRCIVGMQNL